MEREQGVVDESLIEELLRLTPEQRLRENDRVLRMVVELERGLARSHVDPR